MEYKALHFFDDPISVEFDLPPIREKSPTCPDRFTWNGERYQIGEKLAEWSDFTRRGKMARNMRPAHATVAASRGSLGVGRFFFRVRTQNGQIFDLYYDRAPKDANRRKGEWFLYRELSPELP
jgi:hypothetical protein